MKSMAGTLVAAALVAISAFWWRAVEAEAATAKERDRAVKAEVATAEERDRAVTAEQLAEQRSYSAHIYASSAALSAGNVGEAKRLHALCPEQYRNWEWNQLLLGMDQSLQILEGHKSRVNDIAWSPDGKRIVSGSQDTTLRIWDAVSGESLQTLEGHTMVVQSVAWSPDGTRIASGADDGTVQIWESASGERLHILMGTQRGILSVSWSPDGKHIVSGASDYTLRTWNAVTGKSMQTLKGHGNSVFGVAWSPDGKRIVSGARDQTIRLWDPASGESVQSLEAYGSFVFAVAWSPDGTRILSGGEDNTLRVWETRLEDALPMWRTAKERHRLAEIGNPEDIGSLNSRAWPLVDPDRTNKDTNVALGLRLMRAAVEGAPGNSAIHDTLAWALFANSLYDEAIAASEKALELATEETKSNYQGYLDRLKKMIAEAKE